MSKEHFFGAADAARGIGPTAATGASDDPDLGHRIEVTRIMASGLPPHKQIAEINAHPTLPADIKSRAVKAIADKAQTEEDTRLGAGVAGEHAGEEQRAAEIQARKVKAALPGATSLDKYYAQNPHIPVGEYPSIPHNEIDSEGNAVQLTPAQKAANDLAREAQGVHAEQEAAKKNAGAANTEDGADLESNVRGLLGGRKNRPANEVPGVGRNLDYKVKVHQQLIADHHADLDTTIGSLESIRGLSPRSKSLVNQARNEFAGVATPAKKTGDQYRRGVMLNGKRISGDAEATVEYGKATKSYARIHNLLSDKNLHAEASAANMPFELPDARLNELKVQDTMSSKPKQRTLTSIPVGPVKVDPHEIDLKELKDKIGENLLTDRIEQAQKGTKKATPFERIVTDKGSEQYVPGTDPRYVSGRRRVGTGNLGSTGAIGKTPTFEGQLAEGETLPKVYKPETDEKPAGA